MVPTDQRLGCRGSDFGVVEAKQNTLRALHRHTLHLDNGLLGVPNPLRIGSLGGEKRNVEIPKLQAVEGRFTEQDGLPTEDLAGGEIDAQALDACQKLAHRQVRSDNGRRCDGCLTEKFRHSENRRSGVEKIGSARLDEARGGLGDFLFSRPAEGPAFIKRRETLIVFRQSAAMGALDDIPLGQFRQITPRSGLGNPQSLAQLP